MARTAQITMTCNRYVFSTTWWWVHCYLRNFHIWVGRKLRTKRIWKNGREILSTHTLNAMVVRITQTRTALIPNWQSPDLYTQIVRQKKACNYGVWEKDSHNANPIKYTSITNLDFKIYCRNNLRCQIR